MREYVPRRNWEGQYLHGVRSCFASIVTNSTLSCKKCRAYLGVLNLVRLPGDLIGLIGVELEVLDPCHRRLRVTSSILLLWYPKKIQFKARSFSGTTLNLAAHCCPGCGF